MQVLTNGFADIKEYGSNLRKAYVEAWPLIENRDPGETTRTSLFAQRVIAWDKLPYDSKAIGAGAAMRSGCIGIFYPGSHNRLKLITLAVETSRITHNSAIAILSSVTAALFTAYALEKVPVEKWPNKLMRILESDLIDNYIRESRPKEYKSFAADKLIYGGQWKKYINQLLSGVNLKNDFKFMKNPVLRYKYLIENFSKGCDKPGSCGDDCMIMAYDSVLRSEGSFEKMLVYSILHPGDSDTVGSIAFGLYGGFFPLGQNQFFLRKKFDDLEYNNQIIDLFDQNTRRMVKVYYRDIYMNIAMKNLKQYTKKLPK